MLINSFAVTFISIRSIFSLNGTKHSILSVSDDYHIHNFILDSDFSFCPFKHGDLIVLHFIYRRNKLYVHSISSAQDSEFIDHHPEYFSPEYL